MAKSNRSFANRSGMTLIEVLVVLAILVLLATLFLPATRRSRGAARRTQCKSNLKQMGLALHNYHDSHSTLPPGYIIDDDGPYLGWGWSVMILPFLDASPVYNTVQFSRGLEQEYNRHDMNPPLPVFRCPSDDGPNLVAQAIVVTSNVRDGVVTPGTVSASQTFSRTNYFGVTGYLQSEVGGIAHDASGDVAASEPYVNAASLGHTGTTSSLEHWYCDPQNFQGVFSQNSQIRLKDIKDGTSNVIIVGERYTPTNTATRSVGHGTWLGVPDCSTAAGLAMSLGDTSVKVNAGFRSKAQTTGFGSNHTGGTHFLLGDGSVRFLAENIHIATYRDLSTINDQRQIGDF